VSMFAGAIEPMLTLRESMPTAVAPTSAPVRRDVSAFPT